jgi:hypothetical protein
LRIQHVPGEDFLCDRHGPLRRFDRWQKHFLLQARHIEGKQAAVLDHLPRNLIFTFGEFGERDFLSRPDFVNQ